MKKAIVGCMGVLFLMGLYQGVSAQRAKGGPVCSWAGAHQIDGQLTEWGAELADYHKAQSFAYELRNDAEFLYVAIRITDVDRQTQALGQGIQVMINTEGKKRDGQTVVFPTVDRLSFRELLSADNENRPDDYRDAALQSVRGIRVLRFDRLRDGMISLDNQYGVRAAAAIDSADALCVEIKLPLDILQLTDEQRHAEMAYHIRIGGFIMGAATQQNRPVDPRYYPGYGYPYGGGMPRIDTRPRQENGVWGKFTLATDPSITRD